MARSCQFPNCNRLVFRTDKNTGKGYCDYHWKQASTDIDKRSMAVKAQEKINSRIQSSPPIIKEKNSIDEQGGKTKTKMELFFELIRPRMINRCLLCGGKTEKHNDKTYIRSIAHLYAKKKSAFPSIATHEDNWIELCFWSPACHTNFDNGMISFEYIKREIPDAWNVIIRKSKILFPLMTQQEQGRVPEIILKEIQ